MEAESKPFHTRHFSIHYARAAMKPGFDAMLLGAWAPIPSNTTTLLDIGTGCGFIALMLAQRAPNARVVGVELEPEAAQEATSNFLASPFANRLTATHADIRTYQPGKQFEAIVCNPPYFEVNGQISGAARQWARHRATLSFEELAKAVSSLLSPVGLFSAILPKAEAAELISMCRKFELHLQQQVEVVTAANKPAKRMLMAFGRHQTNPTNAVLVKESEKYLALLAPFKPLPNQWVAV